MCSPSDYFPTMADLVLAGVPANLGSNGSYAGICFRTWMALAMRESFAGFDWAIWSIWTVPATVGLPEGGNSSPSSLCFRRPTAIEDRSSRKPAKPAMILVA